MIVVCALLVALGLAGIVLPVLPGGSLLVGAGILLWSALQHTTHAWTFFAVAALLLVAGVVTKWAVPSRGLRQAGVPFRTQLVGATVAVVGFFVVPIIGFFLGFVAGVYVAELARLRDGHRALSSTIRAVRAAALAIGIELTAALTATVVWAVGVATA